MRLNIVIMNLLDFVDLGKNASCHGGDLELRATSLWRTDKEKRNVSLNLL
jgi:hypothetical protein